jgi:hypothetical protein
VRVERELAEEVKAWYARHKGTRGVWETLLGAVIREVVKDSGNWRNKKRGNPKAGWRAMQLMRGATAPEPEKKESWAEWRRRVQEGK